MEAEERLRDIFWDQRAALQLVELLEFIETRQGFEEANRVHGEIQRQIENLAHFPNLGRPGRIARTRELVINRTGFVAAYRDNQADNRIEVLYIAHGRRQWPKRL
jgi:plasmid stabilization system protein ParE